MKQGHRAAGDGNCRSLCDRRVDLAVDQNAASAIIIGTGRWHIGSDRYAIGVTIEVEFKGTLISIIGIIIKRYAIAIGKHDSGLVSNSCEARVLDRDAGRTKFTFIVHLDTADVSKSATIDNDVLCTISPQTITIMRTIECAIGERYCTGRSVCTIKERAVRIVNSSYIINTKRKIHKAGIGNITTLRLAELQILEVDRLAGSGDIALNIKINFSIRILADERDGTVVAGECAIERDLLVNLNRHIAGHRLRRRKSLGEGGVYRLADLGGRIEHICRVNHHIFRIAEQFQPFGIVERYIAGGSHCRKAIDIVAPQNGGTLFRSRKLAAIDVICYRNIIVSIRVRLGIVTDDTAKMVFAGNLGIVFIVGNCTGGNELSYDTAGLGTADHNTIVDASNNIGARKTYDTTHIHGSGDCTVVDTLVDRGEQRSIGAVLIISFTDNTADAAIGRRDTCIVCAGRDCAADNQAPYDATDAIITNNTAADRDIFGLGIVDHQTNGTAGQIA